nr:uncharacterized protein LOC103349155 isoform X3 [Oryctolagus cuniculus]
MFSVGNGSRVSLFILCFDFCSFDFCRYIFICAPLVSLPGSPGRGSRIPRPESHPGWGLHGAGLTAGPPSPLCPQWLPRPSAERGRRCPWRLLGPELRRLSGALLSCLRWLYKVQDQRIPETRSAPARRLPVEGPLGAPRTGPRGFSGCPQVTTIVHREMDSETPSFGILALPEKGLNVPYPRCHKERTTCLSSCPQVTTIILRKMDSNSPSFRTLALPEEVLNVPRPRCPKDRTPWLLWLPPGHHDRPSPGDVIGDAQLQNPRPSRRGVDVPRPRCPKDRTPWLLRPGEQLLPGKNFVASVGAQGLPCSTASVPAMNRFMSLTETS